MSVSGDTAREIRQPSAERAGSRAKLEKRYREFGHTLVDGWLDRLDAQLISGLLRAQTEIGTTGSVGEIGVHHGRLFILLYLCAEDGERPFCIDVFGDQSKNIDQSGLGDQAIFLSNLALFTKAPPQLEVFHCSSLEIGGADIRSKVGPVRFLSIDGGHTADITENDLIIAEQCLAPDGVAIIDDVFNTAWPGVSEGFFRYRRNKDASLVPFAISVNKVFLCTKAHAARYRAMMSARFGSYLHKSTEMADEQVDVYRNPPGLLQRLLLTRLSAAVKPVIGAQHALQSAGKKTGRFLWTLLS